MAQELVFVEDVDLRLLKGRIFSKNLNICGQWVLRKNLGEKKKKNRMASLEYIMKQLDLLGGS